MDGSVDDVADPLRLNAVELLRQPGAVRDVDVVVDPSAIDVDHERLTGDVSVAIRLVALNDTMYVALKIYDHLNDEFVVTTRSGKQMSRSALTRLTTKYLDKLDHHYKGKKRLILHSLRATFATRLCEAGVSTRVVQGLLGHSNPQTTMRYAAATEAACLDAVRKIG